MHFFTEFVFAQLLGEVRQSEKTNFRPIDWDVAEPENTPEKNCVSSLLVTAQHDWCHQYDQDFETVVPNFLDSTKTFQSMGSIKSCSAGNKHEMSSFEETLLMVSSGKLRARINQSKKFRRVWISDDRLCMEQNEDSRPTCVFVRLTKVRKVMKIQDDINITRSALYVKQEAGGMAVLHFEFERVEEVDIFCRGIKLTLKVLKKKRSGRARSQDSYSSPI